MQHRDKFISAHCHPAFYSLPDSPTIFQSHRITMKMDVSYTDHSFIIGRGGHNIQTGSYICFYKVFELAVVISSKLKGRKILKGFGFYRYYSHLLTIVSLPLVMNETGCHIHFPDSNRTSCKEKSNQVSLSGTESGVEEARIRVRVRLLKISGFGCSSMPKTKRL